MLSLNSLHGTFCQNKLKKQWLEPTSWFVRNSRCIRLSEMNGLVVRTMGFTGCARLHSNKDANNHSRLCGQGCESPPFTGEGTQLQVQKKQQPKAFQVASLPDSSDDSVLTAHGPLQRTANKPKQTKNVRALQLSAYNPTITSPHTSSSLKYFQREVGTVQDSARPKVCNLTHVWRSTPAFFQAIDQEELLASQWGSVSMKPWEITGQNY